MSGVRVQVGERLAYAATGGRQPAAGAASVVFVHGAGMDHTVWTFAARHFARKGFGALAVDLPGHGRSAGPPETSVANIADWLAAFLDARGVGAAMVAGHSMGALAAWEFARRHPARCDRLALLGASMPMPVAAPLRNAAQDNHHAAIDMANTWSHSPAARLGGGETPGAWMLGCGERLLERAAPGVLHADLAACDAYRANDGVACPVVVIIGEADQMTPAKAGLAVAARLSSDNVVRLPECGHSMLAERPNAVLDALADAFGTAAK